MSRTAVISYHLGSPGRESRLSVSGSRGCVCPFIGLPAVHRAVYSVSGREAQLLQAFRARLSCLALRFYPVPPLGNVDYGVFLASGVIGLWSREGCGAGPNLHSVVTSTGALATAGIPNRIPPCPALRLYPGLQVPVSSMTYRRSLPTPRRVLPQQAIFFQRSGMKIEKLGGVYSLAFFLSSSSSLFKDLARPRVTHQSILFVSPGVEAGAPVLEKRAWWGPTVTLVSGILFLHVPFRELKVYHP